MEDFFNDRAQMTIDYMIGMSIFLLTVAFVFQFMNSLFAPFQTASDDATLAADRASTVLVERLLIADKSGALSIIDEGKLNYFNNTRLNYTNKTIDSNNKTNYQNALDELGLLSDYIIYDMNMSVTDLNGSKMFIGGPPLLENVDIGQTRRLVLIVNSTTGYQKRAIVFVRVW
ncbi:hypothetical protein ig2599ANME_1998 [groundwater metagenome]